MKRLVFLCGVVVFGASCGLVGKRTTASDCDTWTDHYKEVARKAMKKDYTKCNMDLKLVDKGIEDYHQSCRKHAGQKYEQKDADCYTQGKTYDDWIACNFARTSVFWGYQDAIQIQKDLLEELCAK